MTSIFDTLNCRNLLNQTLRQLPVLLLLTLAGCSTLKNHGGFVQYYPGEPLSPAEVATINGHDSYRNGSRANDMVRIVAIDNVDLPSQFAVAEGADVVAVKPGRYLVKVLFVSGYLEVDFYRYQTLAITAKPGCRYDISASLTMPDHKVSFVVLPAPQSIAAPEDCTQVEDGPVRPQINSAWIDIYTPANRHLQSFYQPPPHTS